MPFILSEQRDDDVAQAFADYRDYITANKNNFPPGAYELASSDWYFNFQDHKCPHDAWLENMTILEPSEGERHEVRSTDIKIRLLAAYHDGYIEFHYKGVVAYTLTATSAQEGMGDWRYDEFRLHPDGHIIHEIEWAATPRRDGSTWVIEAEDVNYSWLPNSTDSST